MSTHPAKLAGQLRCAALDYSPGLAQLGALCRAVAQGCQDCLGVFAHSRADTANTAGCLGEFDGNASLTDLAIAGIFDVHDHLPGHHLWVLKRLGDCIDRANTDVLVLEKLTLLVTRFLAQDVLDFSLGSLHSTIGQPGKVVTAQGKAS